MALTPADFIHPIGTLQPAMFPGENLTTLVQAWINQGMTKVAHLDVSIQDTVATHWVYYRAYSTIAERIASQPSSHSMGGNSGGGVETTVNWGQNRADYWETKAAKALKDFEYYVPPVPAKDSGWNFKVF